MPWVYILQCADGSYYTGMSRGQDLDQRISEHAMKLSPGAYTASRLPVKLVYSEYFDLVADAIFAERKIKGWSRAKKEALIRGDWAEVQRSARRRGERTRSNRDEDEEREFSWSNRSKSSLGPLSFRVGHSLNIRCMVFVHSPSPMLVCLARRMNADVTSVYQ